MTTRKTIINIFDASKEENFKLIGDPIALQQELSKLPILEQRVFDVDNFDLIGGAVNFLTKMFEYAEGDELDFVQCISFFQQFDSDEKVKTETINFVLGYGGSESQNERLDKAHSDLLSLGYELPYLGKNFGKHVIAEKLRVDMPSYFDSRYSVDTLSKYTTKTLIERCKMVFGAGWQQSLKEASNNRITDIELECLCSNTYATSQIYADVTALINAHIEKIQKTLKCSI